VGELGGKRVRFGRDRAYFAEQVAGPELVSCAALAQPLFV
jgi:hypothetical protein